MCRADIEKIASYLGEHLNETKFLSEWNANINDTIPRRLTARELAVAFKIIKYKGIFKVTKNTNLYCFSS